MICPLMSMQFHSIDLSADLQECEKENCAWWVGEKVGRKRSDQNCCAIKLIAERTV